MVFWLLVVGRVVQCPISWTRVRACVHVPAPWCQPNAASGLPPTPWNISPFFGSPLRAGHPWSQCWAVVVRACSGLGPLALSHTACAAGRLPGPAAVYSPYSWLAASHLTAPSAVLAWFDAHSARNHGVVRCPWLAISAQVAGLLSRLPMHSVVCVIDARHTQSALAVHRHVHGK